MNLVEIDVVGSQPLERGFHRIHDVSPRSADVVTARPGAPIGLGSDDDIFTSDAQVGNRLGKHLLRFAIGVDIRRIHEVDARVYGEPTKFIRKILLDTRNRFPHAFARGKGHGAEAELGDEKARVAKSVVFHRHLLLGDGWYSS